MVKVGPIRNGLVVRIVEFTFFLLALSQYNLVKLKVSNHTAGFVNVLNIFYWM